MTSSALLSLGFLAINAVILSGCAESRRLVINESVGPVHVVGQPMQPTGSLIVYSAWDKFDTLDTKHPKHTSYTIGSELGTNVLRVRNRCGSFEGDPEVVSLAGGRYWIEADATNVGPIKVPAVIREGEMTMVYLDGTTEPTGPGLRGTNWIRQPNGSIVGWRDTGKPSKTDRASVSE